MIAVNVGAATSAGKVRSLNEDDYVATAPVFVVADGMGGHAGGEVASSIAVAELGNLRGRQALQPRDVLDAVARANDRILLRSEQDPTRSGMGTTLAGLVAVVAADVDHWLVVNVGDSRVYRYAGGELAQLSTDHSEVQELVGAGRISKEEARSHPRRNIVTRSLGSEPGPQPDQWLVPPALGERYVVCSDGLVGELTDAQIETCLRSARAAQEVADELVERAVAAGGRDNITVLVIDVLSAGQDGLDEDTVPRPAVPA